jgi:hypothetical protein
VEQRRTRTHCSFCGRPREEGRRLVAGPGVFICADCVQLCAEILASEARPTGGSEDRVGAELVRKKPAVGERWRGLMRRLRLWRVASGEVPTVPADSPPAI